MSADLHTSLRFLQNGGELGELIRKFPWHQTPLGPVTEWPQSLVTPLGIMLHARFPMFIYWGPEFHCFYNDSHRDFFGNDGKHPGILGIPGAQAFPEAWPVVRPLMQRVLDTGEDHYSENQLVPIFRNGKLDDVYWTFSFSPMYNEAGERYGIFVTCSETTSEVLHQRRLQESEASLQQIIRQEVQNRERIEKSESYFRELADTVPAILWITDEQGYCTYLNRHWYQLTGQTKEEAEGFGWLNATHPGDFEPTGIAFQKANNAKIDFSAIYRLRIKDGTYRWAMDRGSPKYSAEGHYEGMIGTVVDIHEQTVSQEKIKTSEDRFRSLVSNAPVAMGLFIGRELVIQNPNQAFIDMMGKGNKIAGLPLAKAMPELLTENQPFLQILDDVYTTGIPFETKGTLVKVLNKGTWTNNYYNFSYTPLADENGQTYAILEVAIDVTEQVQAKKELETSQAELLKYIAEEKKYSKNLKLTTDRLSLAIEAGELGLFEVDLVTDTINPSPRYIQIFDNLKSNRRKDYVNLLHPEDLPIREKALEEAKRTGRLEYVSRINCKNGRIKWGRFKADVSFDEAGRPLRLLGLAQDITDQKELEAQKDSFLGIASHELKTPVTSIKAYAQLMEQQFSKSGELMYAGMMNRIDKQVNRLSFLISNLLDVTQINSGKLSLNFSSFNFEELVAEVVDDMQRISPKHTIVNHPGFRCRAYADRDRLYQVITNLISNGIKYSPQASVIMVNSKQVNGEIEFSVEDYGIGINPEGQKKIFEQFYRVNSEREHRYPGLGLGLYISSEIIKRMNGRIWFESAEGEGSTFYFSFPANCS